MAKFIFVTGGVMSGVGKGVATSSIAALLQARGFKTTAIKIDPYINVDAGTMNPVEHGEVFVTDQGTETDQDLGNYERFLNQDIPDTNYLTTGKIYEEVIKKERNLEYDGKTVEVVPHITDEIINRIKHAARHTKSDFVLVEIGGTVGEYQNATFLEAARIMHLKNPKNVLFVLVSYLPFPKMIGEMKTKPTQHAVRELNSTGIQPDMIIARSEQPLDDPRKQKIATFCNMREQDVISAPDIQTSIYEIPVNFEKENVASIVLEKFGMRKRKANMQNWNNLTVKINKLNNDKKPIKIGIVGKYFETGNFVLPDSYLSVIEAIKHASWANNKAVSIDWINARDFEGINKKLSKLKKYSGIIVPGGYGSRGVEGKINVIKYCRTNKIPFLGLCYGMQLASVEFARNVCGLKNAHTTEVQKDTQNPVVDILPEQKTNLENKFFGATMRLGAYECNLVPGTLAYKYYGKKTKTSERHRHRYEFNNNYRNVFEKNGMVFSGINMDDDLVEIIELKKHPFFIATQFHPEFKSRPFSPHPLFVSFMRAL